jgi:molecular chaperone DnaJ
LFRREGRDLYLDLPISVREAILGAQVEVPTLKGRVTVTIPPGTDSGTKLRLRSKGVPQASGRAAGDLYVVAQIKVPKGLAAEARARIEAIAELHAATLRKDLD